MRSTKSNLGFRNIIPRSHSLYLFVSLWRLVHSQAKTPMVLCIVHVGKVSEEMYFLSVIVIIRQKIRFSREACMHVWQVIRGT